MIIFFIIICHRYFDPKLYPFEAFIMAARQLRIVSQVDAFTTSVAKKIQYVFKKLVCLCFFVKGVFDIYLNNLLHIVFSVR